MATEPRSGLDDYAGYATGSTGWGTGALKPNTLRIARFAFHLSVKSRILTAPPGSEADGDTYIPAATATGAWAGKEGQVAVYDATAAAYVFSGAPRKGWRAFIEDEEVVSTYTTAWSPGESINKRAAVSMTSDANKTLTTLQAASGILDVTSTVSLTATRNIVVPLTARQWTVYNGTTGAQSIQVIGATGTGITVAIGKRAILYADGTNIVRVTADT